MSTAETRQIAKEVRSHLAVASEVASKSWVWPQLHYGDCQQDNGTIIFNSDGTGSWSCQTLTYHTFFGDVWHADFDVYATNGAFLFSLGTFDSPEMDDGNPPPVYPWGPPFVFNPDFFDAIGGVNQRYSC